MNIRKIVENKLQNKLKNKQNKPKEASRASLEPLEGLHAS